MDQTKYIYDRVSFVSVVFFAWLIPLVRHLRRINITAESIPEVPRDLKFDTHYKEIRRNWELECQSANPQFLKAVWKSRKWEYFACVLMMAWQFYSQLIQSVIVYYLIQYLKDDEASVATGTILTFLFLINQLSNVLVPNQGYLRIVMLSSKLKSWSCMLVAEKLLGASNTELNSKNEGSKATNVIGNDIELLEFLILTGNIPNVPVVFIASFLILYYFVGFAGVLGLILIASQVPIMIFLGKITSGIRMTLAKFSDSRVKMISNLIEGIKMIKLYAWEKPLLDMIFKERAVEIREFVKMAWVQVTSKVLTMGVLALTSIIPLLYYVHQGNTLTSEIAFLAVGVFYTTNTLFNYFGALGLRTIFLIHATFRRITEVLLLEKVPPTPVAPSGFRGVRVVNATFSWNKPVSTSLYSLTVKS